MLTVRPALGDDIFDILKWRNDATTRAMSRNEAVISKREHISWFSNIMQDPFRLLIVGEWNDKKIGMVRFDRQREKLWEANIVVAPEYRGKKFGRPLLTLALKYFYSKHQQALVNAEILHKNIKSQHLFISLGFKLVKKDHKLLYYNLSREDLK